MLPTAIFLFVIQLCNGYLIFPNVTGDGLPGFDLQPVNWGDPPAYLDWRERKMVSPVKNQLTCAACWAFSTLAGIESHVKIYKGVEVTLSEQFLIDCDESEDVCTTGSILGTYGKIVSKYGGVLLDDDYYPYAERKRECRWHKPPPHPVPVIGFRRVPADENQMVKFLWQHGPLTAAINAASMEKYDKPVIDEPSDEKCDPKRLTHSVLIVGYSFYKSKTGKETPFWIIKNSWGDKWGDRGYYYLIRGQNACGIASDVSFPIVA